MCGDPALWHSDPTTTRLPLPPTAEIIVQAQVGVRKLSQASALLLGLPPQPKADRQPPGRAASPSGPTQCLHWRRRGLDPLNLLSNCWALPAWDRCVPWDSSVPTWPQPSPHHIQSSDRVEVGLALLVSLGEDREAELGPKSQGLGSRWMRIPPVETIIQLITYQILLGITTISFLSVLKYNFISSHSYLVTLPPPFLII